MKKRIISVILVLVMLFAMVPEFVWEVDAAAEESWLWPVEGIYSMSRGYYANYYGDTHLGIDITAANIAEKNVRAAKSGQVIANYNGCYHTSIGNNRCSCSGGRGNFVQIQHDDGTVTRYLHFKQGSAHALGRVEQGEVIGQVWSSGDSSGYHLHFDIWNASGVRINSNPTDSRHTYSGAHDAGNISYIYEVNSLIKETYSTYGRIQVTANTTYVKTLPCSRDTDPNSDDIELAYKGMSFVTVGLVRNSAGNLWYKVAVNENSYGYMYAGGVEFGDAYV